MFVYIMPNISNKGKGMPASPIRKLTPFAERAKLQGKTVYHLNIGQPDIETPEVMMNAIRNVDFKVLAYTQSEGTTSYRAKLADYYNHAGYNVTAEDILVTSLSNLRIWIGLGTSRTYARNNTSGVHGRVQNRIGLHYITKSIIWIYTWIIRIGDVPLNTQFKFSCCSPVHGNVRSKIVTFKFCTCIITLQGISF